MEDNTWIDHYKKYPEELEKIKNFFENDECSKPFTDIDEKFKDLEVNE